MRSLEAHAHIVHIQEETQLKMSQKSVKIKSLLVFDCRCLSVEMTQKLNKW